MKTKLIALLLILVGLSCPAMAAGNSLTLGVSPIAPGAAGKVIVNLNNSDACYGLQADVALPTGLVLEAVSTAARTEGCMATANVNAGKERFVVMSMNKPLAGNSGAVCELSVRASSAFAGGSIRLSNIKMSNGSMQDVVLPDVSANIANRLDAGLSIADFEVHAGGSAEVPVLLTNNNTVAGVQADIYIPEGMSIKPESLKTTARTAGFAIDSKLDGSRLRVLLYSLSGKTVSGNSGAIFTFEAEAAASASGSAIIELKDVRLSDPLAVSFGASDASAKVTYLKPLVASVELLPTSAILKVGEKISVKATVLPANAGNTAVTWSVSNPQVATVNSNGELTALALGTTTLTASSVENPDIKGTCEVTVIETPAGSIVIDKDALGITGDNLEMRVGDVKTIKVSVEPATTTDKSVTFVSSKPAIASVDANGKVTALALGTTTITITAKSGVSAQLTVNVVATSAASISLNKTSATLKATESVDLIATVLPATTTDKSVTWKSADNTIATVDANGKVTAVAVGKTTITATAASGVSATCEVTVIETPAGSIVIDKDALGITGDNLEMRVGDVKTIKVTVEPTTTTDKSVTFVSSTPSVASVDADGKVTALALGTTTITITAKSGVSAQITVNVIATSAASISLNKTSAILKASETVDLIATVLPATTTDKSVTWKSANNAIATVDANGKVTAVAVGKTTITATAASGISATCEVTVIETPAGSIVIDKDALGITGDNLEMRIGEIKTIKVSVEPATTTDKSVTFVSSKPSVASVDANGKVTALALGTTTITITAKSGVSAQLTVNVVATSAASISLNKTSATLKATETVDLIATVLPATTTDKSVTWKSANNAIATVDANGKVTAVAVGKTTITATAASGVSATCEVTVIETPAGSIVIDKDALGITGDNLEMRIGDVKTIKVTVEPATTTDKSVTFVSSNPAVASVDANGKVTALAIGTTTITITAKSGVSAKITVTVKAVEANYIGLNTLSVTLKATESTTLIATVLPENTTDKSVTWKSADNTIATVDANGKVTAVAVGKTTITATAASGVSATCEVTVIETPAGNIVIDKDALGITGDNLEMRVGDVKTIKVSVEPATTTDKSVTFVSSKPAIASVDANGKVTALALGTTTITITAKSGVSAQITVNVIATPAASISLNKSSATLKAAETVDLIATVLPETTTDKSVTWTSADNTIATVDANGKVTAVAVGKTTITATAASGVSATCEITVIETPAGSIVIDKEALGITGDNLEMRIGEVKTIKVSVEPATTTDKTVTFVSSNPAIASVDADGKVTALALGTTTITITAKSGVSAQITVKVVAVEGDYLALNTLSATLKVTETVTLIATVLPENTTDKTVTWKSANEAIATVDANGKVTAVAVGKTTITATAASGVSATCEVTVIETPAGSIVIDKDALGITGDALEMRVGEVKTIKVTVEPETTTDKTVTFVSSNPAVASVDADGKVTALALGTSTITITAKSGVSAQITVNVVATSAASISLNKTSAILKATETVDLIATVLPETTTDKSVTWKSADNAIATVDANGKVTAVAVGKTTITATAASGVSATCEVTVIETPAGSIVIDKDALGITGDDLEMRVGEVKTIKVTVEPETTTDKTVTFESSDPSIASVDSDGNVTALVPGTTTITITAKSGVSAQITVKVMPEEGGHLSLNPGVVTLKVSETVTIIATVYPETATDKKVMWRSEDSRIASVDDNGKVTANSAGSTAIIATTASGLANACLVTVVPRDTEPISVVQSDDFIVLMDGDTAELKVTVSGGYEPGLSYTWSSLNQELGNDNSLIVTGKCSGSSKSNRIYSVRVTDVCDGAMLFDKTYDFEVETWPRPASSISIESPTTNGKYKVREGSKVTLTAGTVTGGYESRWEYLWFVDGEPEAGGEVFEEIFTMPAGKEKETRDYAVTLVARNLGPDGTVWNEVASDPVTVTVYRRPQTPVELLRKGSGASHTLIAMSQLSDDELTRTGYNFAYGYGESGAHISDKRYFHMESKYFDDNSYDKWCYTCWTYPDGSVVTSGKRYLSGKVDEDFDASVFSDGDNPRRVLDFSNSRNWVRSSGNSIEFNIEADSDTRVEIYNMSGLAVESFTVPGGTFVNAKYGTGTLAPGFYVVSVTSANDRVIKKVALK